MTSSLLLTQARQERQAGRDQNAAGYYRQLLDVPEWRQEAQDFLLQFGMKSGNYADVVYLLEVMISGANAKVQLHLLLGQALQKLTDADPTGTALSDIVKGLPFAYSSRLILGRLKEVRGDVAQAMRDYLVAINTANGKGYWHNEASTPPWCRPFVSHALVAVQQYRQELFHTWLEPVWHQFGRQDMSRVEKAVKMYSGEIPKVLADSRQVPSFLYVPDLPICPVFERQELVFAEEYESQAQLIKEELLNLLNSGNTFKPFQEGKAGEGLTKGGEWNAYFFHRHGQDFDVAHQQCPHTSKALSGLPLVNIQEHAPEVCFSIMQPGTHILPHRGVTNSRVVLHLGLVIPQYCRLNLLDVQEITWQEGRTFAFDDTYLHEAWNRSNEYRAVLLADIWNPHLTEEECLALTTLIEKIGVFNQETAAVDSD
ncbi:hypothetical protein GCM10009092_31700 [Bowmanella denitrificans]|uniref:Aspartyl/asparaginy/proline hydroxylase domain-containing protein n=1 Tax=Bowmanella denitrificans TaxID=366582 RepID=A0ABP3HAQ3_9ALTE